MTTTNSIRQAIITSYSERIVDGRPIDTQITATCASGSLTIQASPASEDLLYQTAAWRYAEHERAAKALMERMGWSAGHDIVGGALPDRGYAFIQVAR